MRVADFCITFLADRGVGNIFMVTGGGAMHLNDAIGRETRIKYVCNHHEQASAMAAEGFARVSGSPGVVCVTSGPGGINALNGVFGAFTDSIPMIIISGQGKRETLLPNHGLLGRLRQLGDQEVDIIGMVKNITKWSVQLNDPEDVCFAMEKAWTLSQEGRPGPCWIDIPVDVQAAEINPFALRHYLPEKSGHILSATQLESIARIVLEKMSQAKRPVILAGTGVRISGATTIFRRFVDQIGIPVATAWTHDILETISPYCCGKAGTIGDRAGNFTVQNSDCLLVIGSRLNIRQVSYNWENFAPNAFKIIVDVDPEELSKPMVRPDMAVCADAKEFLEKISYSLQKIEWDKARFSEWLGWCRNRVFKYPVFDPIRQDSRQKKINPYHFANVLFSLLADDDVVVCGDATACIVTFQSSVIRRNTRVFSNSGSASMGYDLPAAVGAAVARGGKRVICMAGDGSLQMNIQELQTLFHHQFPIKIFVLNNGGYLSIRQTQSAFFGLSVGSGPESGVSVPDFVRVSQAFGINSSRLENANFKEEIYKIIEQPGPFVCEVVLDPNQGFEPKLSSRRLPDGRLVSSSLEDMAPFLPREEMRENMIPKR